MKIKVGTLRRLVSEAGEKIGAHPSYIKKEKVRERMQELIVEAVVAGDVNDQESLREFVATVNMAMSALKMVPFEVFQSLADQRPGAVRPPPGRFRDKK